MARFLLASAWFADLAVAHAEALVKHGHSVQVIVGRAPSITISSVPIYVGPARIKDLRNAGFARKLATLRSTIFDTVVVDETWDPRYSHALIDLADTAVVAVHDAVPHDETHRYTGWKELSRRSLRKRASLLACFSESVALQLRGTGKPLMRLPLTSDYLGAVPDPATDRRDFVCFGRARPYKNVRTVLEAWSVHVGSEGYKGDRLIVTGTPTDHGVSGAQWANVVWISADQPYSSLLPVLRRAKANVSLYTSASQSGVQVLAAQHSVCSIVSNVGGLPEYQAPGAPIVNLANSGGLVDAFNRLSDVDVAVRLGAEARLRYQNEWSASEVARRLLDELSGRRSDLG